MNKKPNLVLGAVRGYSFDKLRPFVTSLKRTEFKGDLVLLWDHLSDDTLVSLRDHGVKSVYFEYWGNGPGNSRSRFWPILAPMVRMFRGSSVARQILKRVLPLQCARFLAYYDFLSVHRSEYGSVLITDVRDVLFQSDPF